MSPPLSASARALRLASLEVVVVVPPGQTCVAVRRQTDTIASTGSVVSKLAELSEDALAVSHSGENW